MVAVRTVAANRRLPHQIGFRAFGPGGIGVTCNCRVRRGEQPFGALGHGHGQTAWEIYQAGAHHTAEGQMDRLVTGAREDYALT